MACDGSFVRFLEDITSSDARLDVTPRRSDPSVRPAYRRLGVEDERDARLFVPRSALGLDRIPLLVWLHGAGGGERDDPGRFAEPAQRRGFAVLLPASRERTWDLMMDGYGPDVAVIERSLEATWRRIPVDVGRLAIGGFSDGASYALSLGLTNGDLFTHVIAASPGFVGPVEPHGRPDIFLSHGTEDGVLPIDQTSRDIVPQLRGDGYAVRFVVFDGPHAVPPEVARTAVRWFLE